MASDSALLERLARRKSIFCLLSFEELLFLYDPVGSELQRADPVLLIKVIFTTFIALKNLENNEKARVQKVTLNLLLRSFSKWFGQVTWR